MDETVFSTVIIGRHRRQEALNGAAAPAHGIDIRDIDE
jgi:hypothetical protein